MAHIKINQTMLLEELYKIISFIDPENNEAKSEMKSLINLISNHPIEESKSNFPFSAKNR